MKKKKSYMDTNNILSEGILSKILTMIMQGKGKQLHKKVKSDPVLSGKVSKFEKAFKALEKEIKKARKTGKPIPPMEFDV